MRLLVQMLWVRGPQDAIQSERCFFFEHLAYMRGDWGHLHCFFNINLYLFRVISHQLICNFELTWSLHWQKSFLPKTNNVFIFSRRRALHPAQTCLWSPRLALVPECCCCGPRVSGRSLLHNGLLLRNEPPPLRRQTRRINCKDNCVSCGRLENPRQALATVTVVVRQ